MNSQNSSDNARTLGRAFIDGYRRRTGTEDLTQENTRDGMHLTVSSEGLVSLWDTEAVARQQRQEQYVHIELSVAQQASILLAASLARRVAAR